MERGIWFCEERTGCALCPTRSNKISSITRSNTKQLFDTRHATFALKYPARNSRKKTCQELLRRVQASEQQLRVFTQQDDSNSANFASYLAKVRNKKPFTDSEYAKNLCLVWPMRTLRMKIKQSNK